MITVRDREFYPFNEWIVYSLLDFPEINTEPWEIDTVISRNGVFLVDVRDSSTFAIRSTGYRYIGNTLSDTIDITLTYNYRENPSYCRKKMIEFNYELTAVDAFIIVNSRSIGEQPQIHLRNIASENISCFYYIGSLNDTPNHSAFTEYNSPNLDIYLNEGQALFLEAQLGYAPVVRGNAHIEFEDFVPEFDGNIYSLIGNGGNIPHVISSYVFKGLFKDNDTIVTAPDLSNIGEGTTSLADNCFESMFQNCTNLVYPPKLPWIIIDDGSYKSMFEGCESLVDVSSIFPDHIDLKEDSCRRMFANCTSLTHCIATEIYSSRYGCHEMFSGCISLKDASNVNIHHVPWSYIHYAYSYMFDGCSSLTTPPNFLPVSDNYYRYYGDYCFQGMFRNCVSLISAPDIPTSRYQYGISCCEEMFKGCVNIVNPPSLRQTDIGPYAYRSMFEGCKNLISTPEFNAEVIGEYTFYSMFKDCEKLENCSIGLNVSSLPQRCCKFMFQNCKNLRNGITISTSITSFGEESCQQMYDNCEYLTNISFNINQHPTIGARAFKQMFYNCKSLPNGPERIYASSMAEEACYQMFYNCNSIQSTAAIRCDSSVYDRAFYQMYMNCAGLTTGSYISVTGDLGERACYQMFKNCINLIAHGFISVTDNIEDYCCYEMFNNCANLTTFNRITADNVGDYSLYCMFAGCKKLYTMNELSAISVGESGCESMFEDCVMLANIPSELPMSHVGIRGYAYMFHNCGRFSRAPEIAALYLDDECFRGMFKNCRFTTGPSTLRALEMKPYCYAEMFSGNTKLLSAPSFPSNLNILAEYCFYEMFAGCNELISAPSNFSVPNAALKEGSHSYMFKDCWHLRNNIPSNLAHSNLPKSCYEGMFYNCGNLLTAPEFISSGYVRFGERCCHSMYLGCYSLTTSPIIYPYSNQCGNECFVRMFMQCDNLSRIRTRYMLYNMNCTLHWVSGVDVTDGIFEVSPGYTDWPYGSMGVPSGWSIVTV